MFWEHKTRLSWRYFKSLKFYREFYKKSLSSSGQNVSYSSQIMERPQQTILPFRFRFQIQSLMESLGFIYIKQKRTRWWNFSLIFIATSCEEQIEFPKKESGSDVAFAFAVSQCKRTLNTLIFTHQRLFCIIDWLVINSNRTMGVIDWSVINSNRTVGVIDFH